LLLNLIGANEMNEYDFRRIDKDIQDRICQEAQLINVMPPQFEWIPIGEYNGVDLPDIEIDENYIVWIEIECPEYECEVMV
jgi:hypothetical protein